MPTLGAHMSIAGGCYKAAHTAAKFQMDTVQIFTASPRSFPETKTDPKSGNLLTKIKKQWHTKPLTDETVEQFRTAIDKHNLKSPCAHAGYLINLASPKDDLREKSLEAFLIELQRAELLGLQGVVIHPGSFVNSNEEIGITRIAESMKIALEETAEFNVEIWLETTAGQGTNLGWRFEHLRDISQQISPNQWPKRLGICVDTCHIFAAGYPLQQPEEYEETFNEFDEIIGTKHIRAFHLNDSKKELGSRVDRHEHLGEGFLGEEPFRYIVNDPRFSKIPMYLETPKGERDGQELDAMNLGKLRKMFTPTAEK